MIRGHGRSTWNNFCNFLFILSCFSILAHPYKTSFASASSIVCSKCQVPGCALAEDGETYEKDAVCEPVENYMNAELEKRTQCTLLLNDASTSWYGDLACEAVVHTIGDTIQLFNPVKKVSEAIKAIKGVKAMLATWNRSKTKITRAMKRSLGKRIVKITKAKKEFKRIQNRYMAITLQDKKSKKKLLSRCKSAGFGQTVCQLFSDQFGKTLVNSVKKGYADTFGNLFQDAKIMSNGMSQLKTKWDGSSINEQLFYKDYQNEIKFIMDTANELKKLGNAIDKKAREGWILTCKLSTGDFETMLKSNIAYCNQVCNPLGPSDEDVCNDRIPCTTNACDPITGSCVYTPNDSYCSSTASGEICDLELGCVEAPTAAPITPAPTPTVGPVCGDGICSPSETAKSCRSDCPISPGSCFPWYTGARPPAYGFDWDYNYPNVYCGRPDSPYYNPEICRKYCCVGLPENGESCYGPSTLDGCWRGWSNLVDRIYQREYTCTWNRRTKTHDTQEASDAAHESCKSSSCCHGKQWSSSFTNKDGYSWTEYYQKCECMDDCVML